MALQSRASFISTAFSFFGLTYEKDKFGFCFISGVPPTPEATEELSRRIGFIRETQCLCSYGIVERNMC